MDNKITLQAELWRERDAWRMILRGPRWLISGMAGELHPGDIGLKLANWGGPSDNDNHTLLLVPCRFQGPPTNSIGSALTDAPRIQWTNGETMSAREEELTEALIGLRWRVLKDLRWHEDQPYKALVMEEITRTERVLGLDTVRTRARQPSSDTDDQMEHLGS